MADVGRHIITDDGDRALIVGYTSTTVVTANILDGSFALVASPEAAGTWDLQDSPAAVLQATVAGPVGIAVNLNLFTTIGKTVTAAGWRSADAGRYVHILGGTVFITSITSDTIAAGRVVTYLEDWTSTVDYAIGNLWTCESPTWTDARGYPATITLGEQRLWAAGAAGEPDAIRATVTGDYYAFAPGGNDDNAIAYFLATNDVNIVRWLRFWKGLIVGAIGGETVLRGTNSGPLTPDAPDMLPQTTVGVAAIPPERLGNTMLFVDDSARAVHAWSYDVVTDSYEPDNLMDFANHLTDTYVFQRSAAQKTAHGHVRNLVWYVRSDGLLCCLTFNKKQQVIGWSRHSTATPGGTSTIMSAAVIRNPVKNRDDLWLSITRSINGTTQRTIEVMDWTRYLDCSIAYTGAATATITGLSHLNGDVVSIRGKDASGVWRLTATLTTPRLEGQGVPSLQGRVKGIGQMVARFYDTPCIQIGGVRYKGGGEGRGLTAGYSAAAVYVVPTGTSALAASGTDGEIELVGGTDYDRAGRVTISQDLPVGGTVLLLAAEVDVGA